MNRKSTNPRYDRSLKRSSRIPLTLIDASVRANIARDLRVFAAAIHAWRPCHAQTIQRYAAQINDSYTAAQAVSNYTTTPQLGGPFAEPAFTDPSFSSGTFTESTFLETSSGPPE